MSDALQRGPTSVLSAPLREMLEHASRAPSGHNAQPWMVRVPEPGRLMIGSAAGRWLPAIDPANRELLLSIGAFLENFIVTARHFGYEVNYRIVASSATDVELLDLQLVRASAVGSPLEKIRLRRTVRSHHLPQELRPDDVRYLSASFGAGLAFVPRESTEGRYLERGTIEANRLQVDRDEAQEELSRWIRWSDDDVHRFRDGLTPASLGITGIAGWYVRHFMTPSRVMKKNFRDRSVALVRRQLESYGGWLVVTSRDSNVATLIETGRAFERMFVGVRERMIAIHPMSQMLEESPFREEVEERLGVSGVVQFILRASYLKRYPDPASPRKPAAWFVTS